ncbi:glycine cleavage system H protein-like [Pocillopora verrucosa]|nr:uncharacterized protein LOC113665675 [Pocillopora damicornis]XP_058961634.1 glycine cleavage system H protein-like [Pocillopora verrucosa]
MATFVSRACGIVPQFFSVSTKRVVICSSRVESKRLLHVGRCLLAERKYTKKHEWISVDNGIGSIGVTDYAQKELGEVVYAQLPEVEDTFNIGDEIGALESVKAAADIYSPAKGEVSEINGELESNPGLVNESPYDKGWLVKMKVEELADDLLSEEEYNDLVKSIDH